MDYCVRCHPPRDPEETVERCQGQLNDGYGGYRGYSPHERPGRDEKLSGILPDFIHHSLYSKLQVIPDKFCQIPRGQSSLLLSPRSLRKERGGTSTQRAPAVCLTQW